LFNCAGDEKFSSAYVVPAFTGHSTGGRQAGWLDRKVIYPVAIALMRERLLMLKDRFSFVNKETPWGPGRVDTFNAAKVFVQLSDERIAHTRAAWHMDFLRCGYKIRASAR